MGDQRLATSYDLTFHETLMLIQNQEALQNKSSYILHQFVAIKLMLKVSLTGFLEPM